LFIASGNTAVLKAGDGGPSIFLHFLLVANADLAKRSKLRPQSCRSSIEQKHRSLR
jgi:hypothetical protein